jgi:hypothetical protein
LPSSTWYLPRTRTSPRPGREACQGIPRRAHTMPAGRKSGTADVCCTAPGSSTLGSLSTGRSARDHVWPKLCGPPQEAGRHPHRECRPEPLHKRFGKRPGSTTGSVRVSS